MPNQVQSPTENTPDKLRTDLSNDRSAAEPVVKETPKQSIRTARSDKFSRSIINGKAFMQRMLKKFWYKLLEISDSVNLPELFALFFFIRMVFIFPIARIRLNYRSISHNKRMFFYQLLAIVVCEIILALLLRMIAKKSYKTLFNRHFLENVKTYRNNFLKSLNAVDIAVLLYLGFVLISALLADDKQLAFVGHYARNNGFIIQACYVLTYFVISRFLRVRRPELNCYCFSGAMVSVLTLLHYFKHDVLDIGYAADSLFIGPMGNVDYTSAFIAIALILTAAVYITEQYMSFDKDGYLILACFAVTLWAELLVDVDSGMVAMGAALAVALPTLITSLKRVERLFKLLSVGVGTAIFKRLIIDSDILHEEFGKKGWLLFAAELVLVALTVAISNGTIKRNPSRKVMLIVTLSIDGAAILALLIAARIAADREPVGVLYELGQILYYHNFEDRFGSGRIFIWKNSWQLIKKHPFFGFGPDGFKGAYTKTFREISRIATTIEAHNEYLHLWVCSGIFAVGAYLAFLGLMVVKGIRRAAKDPILICCTIGVIGYAVHTFFMPTIPIHMPLMWTLLGMTGAAIRAGEQNEKPVNEKLLQALVRFTDWLNNLVHTLQEKQLQAADKQS